MSPQTRHVDGCGLANSVASINEVGDGREQRTLDSIIVVEPRRGDFDLNNHLNHFDRTLERGAQLTELQRCLRAESHGYMEFGSKEN